MNSHQKDLKMHGWCPVFIAATLFIAVGCGGASSKQPSVDPSLLNGTPAQVRERLLNHIPIATPRLDALRFVKSLGLELTPQSELGYDAFDSIHCRYTVKTGLFGEAIWLIQIDCPNGAVTEVMCEQFGISAW